MTTTLEHADWPHPSLVTSWNWSRDELQAWQLEQFNRQLSIILPHNRFYHAKLGFHCGPLRHLDQLSELPLTSKQELVDSALADPSGVSAHHTFPCSDYSRVHRTSGTSGRPLMLLDTLHDWRWWSSTWQHVLQAAEVTALDRVFLAFSFGPFIGFWSAHQACVDRGAMVVPGGGLSSLARLEFMRQTRPTVVCCTPSYALHLAEVARHEGSSLAEIGVRRLIVAGEAGGSVIGVRQALQRDWQAEVIDHGGATEVGPWGFGWPTRPGLHVIESCFIAELLPLPAAEADSNLCELVLTSLGRYGAPVIRYRTGDVVQRFDRPSHDSARVTTGDEPHCGFRWFPDGIVGRADDMVTIRGVNIFPSSIDTIVRKLPGIVEYRVTIERVGALDALRVEIEGDQLIRHALEIQLSSLYGLRIPVSCVSTGSLPRSELKSRRWIDIR